jgi:hypothetical protein
MNEKPRTYEFQFATSYGFNGIEIAMVAKTMADLRIAWKFLASNELNLDESKVNIVKIVKR